jgi:hypothetical protein
VRAVLEKTAVATPAADASASDNTEVPPSVAKALDEMSRRDRTPRRAVDMTRSDGRETPPEELIEAPARPAATLPAGITGLEGSDAGRQVPLYAPAGEVLPREDHENPARKGLQGGAGTDSLG